MSLDLKHLIGKTIEQGVLFGKTENTLGRGPEDHRSVASMGRSRLTSPGDSTGAHPAASRGQNGAAPGKKRRHCPVCQRAKLASINGVYLIPEMMNGRPARSSAEELDPRRDQPFKVLIVGGSSVGKTCILRRFVDGEFPNKCKATLGLDFKIRCVQVDDRLIKMQLWDTSGQERFRSMTQAYYRGAAGVMVVYDVTEETTLHGLTSWLEDVKKYAPEDVDIIILGNKCDIVEQRVVSKEAGEEFARRQGLKFFETSANDNTNITEAFQEMAVLLAGKVTATRKRVNSIAITSPAETNGNAIKPKGQSPVKTKCAC